MDADQLKAAGFTDQEIRLHQAGFSDDEIRRATAGNPTTDPVVVTPAKKPATLLGTLGRAAYNLPRDAWDTVSGVVSGAAHAVMHPVETTHAAHGAIDQAAAILGGAIQHGREAYPADQQGSAPKMDTGAYDQFSADNQAKYGSKQALYKTVGDHPAGTALAIASILDPALKAANVERGLAGVAGRAVPKVSIPVPQTPEALKVITQAGRRGTEAAEQMRSEATARLGAGQSAAEVEAAQATAAQAEAAQRAQRASTLADTSRAQGRTLNDRRAMAAAQSTPPEPAIGDARHLSDIGDSVRQPAIASQDAINANMRAADAQYRDAMEKVAAEKEAKGIGVSDTNLAKIMVKQSKALVEPDPVKRGAVGNVPLDSAGGKLHRELIDALAPKEVPLTPDQAKAATKAGIKVNVAKDGTFSRTVKPSLQDVDDFRRKVGKVLNGTVDGYEGINRGVAGRMYGNLSKVMDKYADGTSAPVQANWRTGKEALAPFEKVRAGQTLVGTQAGTDVASVPAASIPGRMVAGGRDTVQQVAAAAGNAPVAAALRSQVQNALTGAKTADAAEALVRPGTTLGDAIAADPSLSPDVANHIQQLRNAEAAAAQATSLGRRATTASGRASKLDSAATKAQNASTTLQGKAASAAEVARGYQRDLAQLSLAKPAEVAPQYKSILDRAHAAGHISTQQYTRGLQLAGRAEKDFAIKATRDRWMRRAAAVAGLGAASALGADITHALEK